MPCSARVPESPSFSPLQSPADAGFAPRQKVSIFLGPGGWPAHPVTCIVFPRTLALALEALGIQSCRRLVGVDLQERLDECLAHQNISRW